MLQQNTSIFRDRLTVELMRHRDAIASAASITEGAQADSPDMAVRAGTEASLPRAVPVGVPKHLQVRVRKLEAALARVDCGTYGLCCECEIEISPEQLDADPAAVFCTDCVAGRNASSAAGMY